MEKKSCFIIMPYTSAVVGEDKLDHKTLKYIYDNVLRKAVSEYQLNGQEVFDEISRYDSNFGSIISGIVNKLNSADLVIADLSGLNANVMYELGVRHTLKRGTIIITQSLETLPSDLRDFMCVEYHFSKDSVEQGEHYSTFKRDLHVTISELLTTQKQDSPVLNYLEGKEKYWKEDELKALKNNLIYADYIDDHFDQLVDVISDIQTEKIEALPTKWLSLFSALLNNLQSSLSDLNISAESSSLYEKMQAAKSLIGDVLKKAFLSEYYQDIANVLSEEDREKLVNPIVLSQKQFINTFKLDSGVLEKLSVSDVFNEKGDFETLFLEVLFEHLENKAKEIGLSDEEIDALLKK